MFELGRRPDPLRVLFIRGEDFLSELELLDAGASFGGVPPELVLAGGQSIQASLIEDGDVARFEFSSAAIEALLASEERGVELIHGGFTLAKGRFEVV